MHKRPMVAAFDLVVCLALMFLIVALTASKTPPRIQTHGRFAVTAGWANGSNDDVDLYVRDPQGNICYFGQVTAGLLHLEQDDLGTSTTGTQYLPDGRVVVDKVNIERIILRGIVPGEYTINVHMFNKKDPGPMKVAVQFWAIEGTDRLLMQKQVTLSHTGDEVTVWRVTLDAQGHMSNVNAIPAHLVLSAAYGS